MDGAVRDSRNAPAAVASSRDLNLHVSSGFPLAVHHLYVTAFNDASHGLVGIVEVLGCLIHHLGSATMGGDSFRQVDVLGGSAPS